MRFFVCCFSFLFIFTNCASPGKDILIKFEENRKHSKNVCRIFMLDILIHKKEKKIIKHIAKTGVQNNFAYMIHIAFSGKDKVKFTEKGGYDFWDLKNKTYNRYFFGSEELKKDI